MPDASSEKRYAQAFFELAVEREQLENWRDELHEAEGLLLRGGLIELLESPRVPFNEKKIFITQKLSKINKLTQNLIFLLVAKGKLKILKGVREQYNILLDAHFGITHADVTTALPLSDEEKQGLSDRLEEIAGKKVVIDNQIDPNIVGGFRARFGDMVVDGTVHNILELLKRSLRQVGN